MQLPPPLPAPPPPDWWARNWPWFVPALLVAFVLLAAGLLTSVVGFMKSSDAYAGAVARVRAAAPVTAALGTPIQTGFFVTGQVSVYGAAGRAELAIPLNGPKGSATADVTAEKVAGEWHFNRLIVRLESGGTSIDLSEKPPAPAVRPARP